MSDGIEVTRRGYYRPWKWSIWIDDANVSSGSEWSFEAARDTAFDVWKVLSK